MLLRARCEFLQSCYMDKCLSRWALSQLNSHPASFLNRLSLTALGQFNMTVHCMASVARRFSALRVLCALCLQTLYVPSRIQKALAHPTPLHNPSGLILVMPQLLSVRLNDLIVYFTDSAVPFMRSFWFYKSSHGLTCA